MAGSRAASVLIASEAARVATALERIALVLERLALRSGVNLGPEGSEVDESYLGLQVEMTEEEAAAAKAHVPPSPPNA